jgi:hypothetical protein
MFLTVYLYESASVLEVVVVVVFVAAVVDTVGLGVTEDAGVDVWRTWGLTLPPGQLRSSGLPGSWIFFLASFSAADSFGRPRSRWSWCRTRCLAWRRPAECRAPCTAPQKTIPLLNVFRTSVKALVRSAGKPCCTWGLGFTPVGGSRRPVQYVVNSWVVRDGRIVDRNQR